MLRDKVEVGGDPHKNRDESPRRIEWTLSFFIIELKTFFLSQHFFSVVKCSGVFPYHSLLLHCR